MDAFQHPPSVERSGESRHSTPAKAVHADTMTRLRTPPRVIQASLFDTPETTPGDLTKTVVPSAERPSPPSHGPTDIHGRWLRFSRHLPQWNLHHRAQIVLADGAGWVLPSAFDVSTLKPGTPLLGLVEDSALPTVLRDFLEEATNFLTVKTWEIWGFRCSGIVLPPAEPSERGETRYMTATGSTIRLCGAPTSRDG